MCNISRRVCPNPTNWHDSKSSAVSSLLHLWNRKQHLSPCIEWIQPHLNNNEILLELPSFRSLKQNNFLKLSILFTVNVDYLHITFHCLVSSRKIDHLTWCVVYIINIVSLKQNEGFTLNLSMRKHCLYLP